MSIQVRRQGAKRKVSIPAGVGAVHSSVIADWSLGLSLFFAGEPIVGYCIPRCLFTITGNNYE